MAFENKYYLKYKSKMPHTAPSFKAMKPIMVRVEIISAVIE